MRIFVMNMRGDPLMPCTQKKAKQDCHIGIDTGSKHIGMAITSENKVLFKGEIELRQVYITNTC